MVFPNLFDIFAPDFNLKRYKQNEESIRFNLHCQHSTCKCFHAVRLRRQSHSASINGEWNIIEVNGSKVTPGESRTLPFITFDTATGRVSGNSGCNRTMGSFDVNAKPGSMELKGMASTRMMCPDMTTERNVLGALAQVKGYKKAGKDKMFLCNESNRPVVVLEKKEADVKLSVLNGEWK